MLKNKLKEDAKRYVEELYTMHRIEDLDAWNGIIDSIFDYIDLSIKECKDASTKKS